MVDSDERYTPDSAIEFAREALGGTIELDPCAEPRNRVGALRYLTKEDDGPEKPWELARTVFINPPFSAGTIDRFVCAGLRSIRSPHGDQSQLWLVPSRTTTRWSRALTRAATAIMEQQGRLHFLGPDYAPILNPKTGRRSSPDFDTRWVLLARGSHHFQSKALELFRFAAEGLGEEILLTAKGAKLCSFQPVPNSSAL